MIKLKGFSLLGVVVLALCWSIGFVQMLSPVVPVVEEMPPAPLLVMDTPEVAHIVPPEFPPIQEEMQLAREELRFAEAFEVTYNLIPARSVSGKSYTRDDLELLATLIHGEAGNQSYDGKLAVGTVVMNRMIAKKSWMGGPSLRGVIYAPGQFCAVTKNWKTPSEASRRAARDVLEGYRSFEADIVYFFAPRIATDTKFTSTVDVVYVIGDHVFGR